MSPQMSPLEERYVSLRRYIFRVIEIFLARVKSNKDISYKLFNLSLCFQEYLSNLISNILK